MRILLVNTLFAPISVGGAERSVRELATGLAARGNGVWVLTLVPRGSRLPDFEEIDGVQVVRWELPRAWPFGDEWAAVKDKDAWHEAENTDDWAHGRIRDLVDRIQPDVVHTHNVLGFGVGIWAAMAGVPVAHTLRDFYVICAEMNLFRHGRRCLVRCDDCVAIGAPRIEAMRHLAALVGVSDDTLARHPVVEPGPRRLVIPNAPDRPRRAADARITRHLGPEDEIVFGMLGRLVPEKGFDVAIEAFTRLRSPGARLEIAGAGTTEAVRHLTDLTAGDPRIRYEGFADSDDFYARIDVLVVPSQWEEPYGRVAAEGRLAGLFVVASAVGGIPEVLAGYGRAVLVDDIDRADAWTAALARAAAGRRDLEVWRAEDVPHALNHAELELEHEELYHAITELAGRPAGGIVNTRSHAPRQDIFSSAGHFAPFCPVEQKMSC